MSNVFYRRQKQNNESCCIWGSVGTAWGMVTLCLGLPHTINKTYPCTGNADKWCDATDGINPPHRLRYIGVNLNSNQEMNRTNKAFKSYTIDKWAEQR